MALNDPHAAKRETNESCNSCRFFFPTPKCHATGGKPIGEGALTKAHTTGDCRRMPPPPNYNGHPTVYVDGWCGEYKEDAHKVAHLKALDDAEKKPQEK